MRLNGKCVLIGVSGGIAAYKVCYLVSALVKAGADVHVTMTENAQNFVSKMTFETLSKNPVTVDTFDREFEWEVEHVALAKRADIAVLCPATANTIAKLATGACPDFLSTTFMAAKCPKLFAPAMNTGMLNEPSTKQNIEKLIKDGYIIIKSEVGRLACGDNGDGRMAEPETILKAIEDTLFYKRDFVGKKVIVTAGATRLYIDPVRFLTNRSSGKMGYSIAQAAYERGADVVFIHGSITVKPYDEWTNIYCETTENMYDAVHKNLDEADVIVMAAAPCDYIVETQKNKIKSDTLTLQLNKTVDIAASVGQKKGDKKLVIFCAETDNTKKNAIEKLRKKNADLAVLNDVTKAGAGFDCDTNIVTLVTELASTDYGVLPKRDVADLILDRLSIK